MPQASPDRALAAHRRNPPPTSRGNGPWLLIVVICLLAAGGAYFYYQRSQEGQLPPEPAPTPRATPLPSPSPTPVPETPMPTPPPTPAATPAPPTPTPAPRATVEPLPALTSLSARQLPLRIAMTRSVTFPLMFNGQPAGQASVPAGAMVRLLEVRGEALLNVQYGENAFSVPPDSTDIYDRVRKLGRYTVNTTPTPVPVRSTSLAETKPSPSSPPRPTVKLGPGTLLSFDFENVTWPRANAGAFGTVDEADSTHPSTGLRGTPGVVSGPLRVHCPESDLGKLTLAFSLSANAARPVTVRIESFDDNQNRTGGLETLIYPAAPDFFQRYAVEMSDCKPFGRGRFDPKSPYVGFSFSVEGAPWQGVEKPGINLDNVHYAVPAYYVSPKGRNTNDGRAESRPFETPQKALDVAEPGDIVVLMDGVYQTDSQPIAAFHRAGAPAAWIVLKNYPGQKPTLTTTGWNTVLVKSTDNEKTPDEPALAYLEIRGLHVRGKGDVAKEQFADAVGKVDSRTNTNGISVDGGKARHVPHHIRMADNLVEYCPGAGLGTGDADWVTIENNISRCNCWTTIYATSGISIIGTANFDKTDNVYKKLVRNNVTYRNETFVMWKKIGKMSDGNGIILDVNQGDSAHPDTGYIGRTLVQSNLSYDNGGSGIHTMKANRVDIVNNTAYLNSASKSLEYGEIFSLFSDDVRIMNNILVAPVADERAGEKPEPVNSTPGKKNNVVYSDNVYFGGNTSPSMGQGDRVADPQFVNPSHDPKTADFHLKAGSPAVGKGISRPFVPYLDLDGKPRAAPPDAGAYQYQASK